MDNLILTIVLCRFFQFAAAAAASSEDKAPFIASVSMPLCDTKESCDEIWEAPNISNCINDRCSCTGGSRYVEREKTCKCDDGFVIGNDKCLPEVKALRESCQEDVQCASGWLGELVACTRDECQCLKQAVEVKGNCLKKKYISGDCSYDVECDHVPNVKCQDNICTCAKGYLPTPDSKSCARISRNLWDPCEEDIQCMEFFGDGSHCRTRCVCKADFHAVENKKCVRNIGAGEEGCSSDSDCYVDNYTNLICVEGKCTNKPETTNEEPKGVGSNGACHLPTLISLILMPMIVQIILNWSS